MDAEKPVQVSFQIPPSALDSLSRLTEQLRLLAESASARQVSGGYTAEQGKSDSFDLAKFSELRQDADRVENTDWEPPAASAVLSDIAEAKSVSAVISPAEDAAAVSAEVREELQNAVGAGELLNSHTEDSASSDMPGRQQQAPGEDSPSDAPVAGGAVERQVSEVESARAEASERELLLAAAQGEVSGEVETPVGAGVAVQVQSETPLSRWSGVAEELVIPGPAPLTAEAVSLAFERDGRRYDNGFPLY